MEEEHTNEETKPGQYLAYEREKRGFTIENIASELHLSVNVIRALEEDLYDKLPELVYVRGYIRSYCRLLNMDPIPVLDMYTANLPKEEDYLLEDLSSSSPVNEHQQRLIMIWGSIAVVAIFLILILSWWQEKQLASAPTSKAPIVQDDSVEQPDINNPNISGTTIKQEAISPVAVPTQILEPIEIKIEKAMQEDHKFDEAVQEDHKPDEAVPDDSPKLNDGNRNIIENSADSSDMPQLVTLAVMSEDESWVRVKDGSGEIIIHRILPTGYNKIFMVNLPLNFELGNAHQVHIMIDGKDYDFSAHIRPSETAAFEVTELP